jgi:uncharacterized protein YdhG (YjbR/CyaY superfamily)
MAGKTTSNSETFTKEERAAMKERAKELKMSQTREEQLAELLTKIAAMAEPDRSMATRIHEIITEAAPELEPKTWYGMPAYSKNGKALVFFQDAGKFKARYSTLGFNDVANLDQGQMWPSSFALTKLTPEVEKQISELVKRAAS